MVGDIHPTGLRKKNHYVDSTDPSRRKIESDPEICGFSLGWTCFLATGHPYNQKF